MCNSSITVFDQCSEQTIIVLNIKERSKVLEAMMIIMIMLEMMIMIMPEMMIMMTLEMMMMFKLMFVMITTRVLMVMMIR